MVTSSGQPHNCERSSGGKKKIGWGIRGNKVFWEKKPCKVNEMKTIKCIIKKVRKIRESLRARDGAHCKS